MIMRNMNVNTASAVMHESSEYPPGEDIEVELY